MSESISGDSFVPAFMPSAVSDTVSANADTMSSTVPAGYWSNRSNRPNWSNWPCRKYDDNRRKYYYRAARNGSFGR